MSAVLVAEQLGRYYGQVVGLNDLTTEIAGGVVGLVGPNGAGKSTLLRLIAGEIRPSRGSVRVLGHEPFANRELFRVLGFCPQQDALYEDMTGFDIVRLLLRLGGFAPAEAKARAERALERLSLTARMHDKVRTYSKGMRQRVRIAQAIAHDPRLLVLDEPMTGLDPLGRREVLELLRELGSSGTHVLFSSHILYEVEHLTAEIVLIHRGRLLAKGALPEVRALLSKHPRRVELSARRPRELARALIEWPEVVSVRVQPGAGAEEHLALETRDVGAFYRRLTGLAARERFGISSLCSADASLEAVFDYLVT
ncbi:MAG: ABC transporter ATP-binding protein [Planctomycetes bacterium]|nr:ABC transporter ATP-binding protein [Planctomycetota bacterium]